MNVADKKAGKFKEWLMIGSHSEPKPTQELIEVLSYLAFETVREVSRKVIHSIKDYMYLILKNVKLHTLIWYDFSIVPLLQIVEMSLQVKKDMEHIDVDPYLAQSARLPLHIPLFATSHLEGISTSCDGVHTSNASPLNPATLGNPKGDGLYSIIITTQTTTYV